MQDIAFPDKPSISARRKLSSQTQITPQQLLTQERQLSVGSQYLPTAAFTIVGRRTSSHKFPHPPPVRTMILLARCLRCPFAESHCCGCHAPKME